MIRFSKLRYIVNPSVVPRKTCLSKIIEWQRSPCNLLNSTKKDPLTLSSTFLIAFSLLSRQVITPPPPSPLPISFFSQDSPLSRSRVTFSPLPNTVMLPSPSSYPSSTFPPHFPTSSLPRYQRKKFLYLFSAWSNLQASE